MNYMNIIFIVISLWFFSGIAEASDKDFFPFDEGRTWEYETTVKGKPDYVQKLTATNLSPNVTDKGKIMMRKLEIKSFVKGKEESNNILYEYYKDDIKGLNFIYVITNYVTNPVPQSPPRYLVYYPITVGSSTKWEDINSSTENIVESINETVTVPSGIFKDCVKIKRKYLNKKSGVVISAIHWYARNVGRVKTIENLPNGIEKMSQLISYSYEEN